LTRKTAPEPSVATSSPPIAGPIACAPVSTIELSEIAAAS
jgi:hypothetical protein